MSENGEDRNVALNFLAGMGVGALIGAVAALLLAPKSGTETRDDIKCAAEDLKTKADKVMHDLSESSDELVKKSKEILESTKSKVQQAIETGKQTVARRREAGSEEAEQLDG
jgi:gas vesicle protein